MKAAVLDRKTLAPARDIGALREKYASENEQQEQALEATAAAQASRVEALEQHCKCISYYAGR